MSTQAIGVKIIGAGGRAGYRHVPTLRTLPEFEVVTVAARRMESAQNAAEKFGIPYAFAVHLGPRARGDHPVRDLV
ncbi:Gfo/Idh/MocA family oxidoreductase [Streptosporangium sp. NBC_01639]|uniref:Gfo/Idh/MocA family oxidoreductase n=1 Tax=Streptosporangium sp. NBC_01639 TaxID=2975948 RepID=UPI0038681EF6|nr:Gfo/Idh/MocA family oxidoreductase [Streptosporangium sp. NBC_01639]